MTNFNSMTAVTTQIKNKPAWGVALLLSLVYFILFLLVSNGKIDSGLLFGFCVWGDPAMPTSKFGCKDSPTNSHKVAFVVDAVMTAATALFGYLDFKDFKQHQKQVQKQGEFKNTIVYVAFGFIIFAHGFLHWFLQQTDVDVPFLPIIDCYNDHIGSNIEQYGYVIFGIFSFALSIIILGFGFGLSLPTLLGSGVFTAAVINLTKDTGGELILPGLFCIVHPLSCFTGLFSHNAIFSETVGALFAVCTTVGILELSSCQSVLRQFGGHVWYDVTLHLAVVMATPYFTSRGSTNNNDGKTKKQE